MRILVGVCLVACWYWGTLYTPTLLCISVRPPTNMAASSSIPTSMSLVYTHTAMANEEIQARFCRLLRAPRLRPDVNCGLCLCHLYQSSLLRSCPLMEWCTGWLKEEISSCTVNPLDPHDHTSHGKTNTHQHCVCQVIPQTSLSTNLMHNSAASLCS